MKKVLIFALFILLGVPQAFAATCFELRDPDNNSAVAGTIDCATDEIDMVGGFTENGSDTLSNDISGNSTDTGAIIVPSKVNEAGGISTGQCVFISGATGQVPQVSLCDNTDLAKEPFFGIAAETKTNGQNILVTQRGRSATFDTSSFSDGDELFMNTAGGLTATIPTSGVVASIGYVAFSHPSNGYLLVGTHSESTIGATSGNDIVLRSGDSAGANKVSFKDFANVEVAAMDSDGNLTLSGTVDGVDIAARDHAATVDTFVTGKDAHDHDGGDGASIPEGGIVTGAVTTPKLAANAVTRDKIAPDSCSVNEILKLDSSNLWQCAADNTGGAGAAILIDTQTFSGANTFTSTTTLAATNKICPNGFTNIENTTQDVSLGCMQTAEQGSASWDTANIDCFDSFGGRLPSDTEMFIAFTNFVLTDETDDIEWLNGGVPLSSTDEKLARAIGSLILTNIQTWTLSLAYRCWIPK